MRIAYIPIIYFGTAAHKKRVFQKLRLCRQGIKSFFTTEKNGRVQGLIALVIIAIAAVLQISGRDWCIILLCIAMVITLEMVNSAIEKLCDMASPNYHPTVKVIKDMCAGAVLIASVIAAIVGCILLLPHINKLLYLF